MLSQIDPRQVYTPQQVASILQLSTNTVYELISRGEIVAKRLGRVYRIPAVSLSFFFAGLDSDLYQADQEDRRGLAAVQEEISKARSAL